MVASYMDKTVTKSYVRLPGSGSDKKASASFCDLSRGSILAASVSVPQGMGMQKFVSAKLAPSAQTKRPRTEDKATLPIDLIKRPRLESIVQTATRTVTAAPVMVSPQVAPSNILLTTTPPRTEPRSQLQASITQSQRITNNIIPRTTTPRIEPQIKPQTPIASPQGITHNFIPTSTTAIMQPLRQQAQYPPQVYVIRNTGPDMKKIQEENEQLKAENASLQKQLSLFKQLMRNPERLQSVVQRLNKKQAI